MSKRFKLAPSQIRPLVQRLGSCIATDHITVNAKPVGYMYRESPDGPHDSGWRFFSGEESDAYVNDPQNLELYDVNTIANYDPSAYSAESGHRFRVNPATRRSPATQGLSGLSEVADFRPISPVVCASILL